ncbi:MAG: (Fe-S)-binding protein, partial [Anaerolineales bacterium]|nr:(Fe-S)-binding protein [Anaerolineales bacterium]
MTENVQLLITCLIDTFFPHIGEAMVNVLNRAGVNVDFPARQTCCGQPAFNAGLRMDARAMAMHTIRVFERPPRSSRSTPEGGKTSEVLPVIVPSGSCAYMIRHGYLELFAADPAWLPRAKSLAARTFEFSEYLVDALGVTDVGAGWDGALTYHSSCHLLRGLGVDRQPRALLAAVKGAEIVELPHADECCGFGGVFAVEHPELSAEFLKRKIANLETIPPSTPFVPRATAARRCETAGSGQATLVVCDTGCLMHIQGGLHHQRTAAGR